MFLYIILTNEAMAHYYTCTQPKVARGYYLETWKLKIVHLIPHLISIINHKVLNIYWISIFKPYLKCMIYLISIFYPIMTLLKALLGLFVKIDLSKFNRREHCYRADNKK